MTEGNNFAAFCYPVGVALYQPHHFELPYPCKLPLPPLSLSLAPAARQMSQVLTRSPKHCANKQGPTTDKLYKKLVFAFSSCFTALLSLVFILWLILRPAKPDFTLKEAHIYQLALAAPNLLNCSIQLTILSENPNQNVGIYYSYLQLYAAYKGQQITSYTSLPPFYQGNQDSNLLTASLSGTGLPVTPFFGYQVGRDQSIGKLILSLKGSGHLRWKVGTWVSGRYRFSVNCVAVLPLPGPDLPSSPLVSWNQATQCATSL